MYTLLSCKTGKEKSLSTRNSCTYLNTLDWKGKYILARCSSTLDVFLESTRAFVLLRLPSHCHSGRFSFMFASLPSSVSYWELVHGETDSFLSEWIHAALGDCFRRSVWIPSDLRTKLESFFLCFTFNSTVSYVSERPQEKVLPREQKKQADGATHHNQATEGTLKWWNNSRIFFFFLFWWHDFNSKNTFENTFSFVFGKS